jgi:hypothetical protein
MENWHREFYNFLSGYEHDGLHLVNLFGLRNDLYSVVDFNHDQSILFKEVSVDQNEVQFNNVDDNVCIIVVLSKSENIEMNTDSQKNIYYHFINGDSFEI